MPGLVPGISIGTVAAAEMDARNKSGHDEGAHPGMTEEPVEGGRSGMTIWRYDGKRVGTPGADPAGPFGTPLNPGHAPRLQKLNRTATERRRTPALEKVE